MLKVSYTLLFFHVDVMLTTQKMIEAATSLTPSVTTEMLINIKDSLDIIFPAELQPDFLSLWNEAQPKVNLDGQSDAGPTPPFYNCIRHRLWTRGTRPCGSAPRK